MKKLLLRIFLGLIGLTIGLVVFGSLDMLFRYFLNEVFGLRLLSIGIIFPIIGSWCGFTILYNYEHLKGWNGTLKGWSIVNPERKIDRLRLVLVCLWFLISTSYIYFLTNYYTRHIDFLDSWGAREWRIFNIVVVPMILIYVGFPGYEKIKKWIDSGK